MLRLAASNLTADKPNTTFTLTGNHRWKDLRHFGQEQILTPPFNRFAANLFVRCWLSSKEQFGET